MLLHHKTKPRYVDGVPFVVTIPSIPWGGIIATFFHYFSFDKQHTTGYEKYSTKNRAFQVSTLAFYTTVVPSSWLNEVRRAPKGTFDLYAAVDANFRPEYIFQMKRRIAEYNRWTIPSIRHHILPTMKYRIPALANETLYALDRYFPSKEEKWTSFYVYDTIIKAIAPIWSRIFLGQYRCRNEKYLNAFVKFGRRSGIWSMVLNCCPEWLRPVAYRFSGVLGAQNILSEVTENLVAEKMEKFKEEGLLADKGKNIEVIDSIDALIKVSCILDEPLESDIIMFYSLALNQAGILPNTMVSMNILYDLAAYPEYIAPLREELEAVLEKNGGWNMETIKDLVKMDSFIKESSRLNTLAFSSMPRKVLAPGGYTFSSGLHIPKDSFISIPSYNTHLDPNLYGTNADTFEGFRFLKNGVDGPANKGSFQDPTEHYHTFGWGPAACPGRVITSPLLKIFIGHILLRYDIRPRERPSPLCLGNFNIPCVTAKLEMRRRAFKAQDGLSS
ncbi:cytochrome P450 [Trichophaea hybrida]|nr:cytochrome P450 [Trichophaea hybrida]